MSVTAVLLPVFVQVGLTFVLLLWTARLRIQTLREGEVKAADIALGQKNWPEKAQQVVNAFENQCQLPVLFYVLVVFALITRKADLLFVILSWLFVLARLVHVYVHVTSNRLVPRFQAFAFGAFTLMLMWIIFALRLVASEAGF
ncbi:MAPEG family protein [Microvirga flavescens]|uniref:MAPEG family protein n=1 Tax=Microvirga flavescens TaxID=2249811 RepID=UPI000DD7A977|nr:MAPEG family protein [Microvirga flavescens]